MIIQAKSNFYGIIGFNGLINLSSLSSLGIPTTDPLESQAFLLYLKPSEITTVDDKWHPLQNIQKALSSGYISISDYPTIIISTEELTNVYSLTKLEIINIPEYPHDAYSKYNENFDKLDGIISAINSSAPVWGSVIGNINSQLDLHTKLNEKANVSGQIFSGSISATNLSGLNTGDQDLDGLVPYTGATTDVDLNGKNISNVNSLEISGDVNLINRTLFTGTVIGTGEYLVIKVNGVDYKIPLYN